MFYLISVQNQSTHRKEALCFLQCIWFRTPCFGYEFDRNPAFGFELWCNGGYLSMCKAVGSLF